MSESLISSFLVSDVSESLRSLTKNEWCERIAQVACTKNEQISESLNFLRESLIRSFLGKKRAICSEIRWANSQPWVFLGWELVIGQFNVLIVILGNILYMFILYIAHICQY